MSSFEIGLLVGVTMATLLAMVITTIDAAQRRQRFTAMQRLSSKRLHKALGAVAELRVQKLDDDAEIARLTAELQRKSEEVLVFPMLDHSTSFAIPRDEVVGAPSKQVYEGMLRVNMNRAIEALEREAQQKGLLIMTEFSLIEDSAWNRYFVRCGAIQRMALPPNQTLKLKGTLCRVVTNTDGEVTITDTRTGLPWTTF